MHKLVQKQYEAKQRLLGLNLTSEILFEAVKAGEFARDNCSALHPKMFGGYSAFSERIKVLREKLIPLGWRSEVANGLELVVNDKLKIALAVCTGADSVGSADYEVLSKYPKGRATKNVVLQNQLSFDESVISLIKPQEILTIGEYIVWYLMVYREKDIVKYELCLPVALNNQNYIAETRERITFDSFLMSEQNFEEQEHKNDTADAFDDEFVVEVSRRI